MRVFAVFVGVLAFAVLKVTPLNNGLALTPPMGWLSWERFRCNTDCANDPSNCLSEGLIKQQAEEMVKQGFLAAGYEYVIVDDCWPDHQRDPETGKLRSDPDRFPSGLKALGDYVHSLGLKWGIYEDYGNFTCGGYPGVLQNMELDAKTLAEWGADYIKLDGCYANVSKMDEGYPEFGEYLNNTGRPIVYSCSWPAYQVAPDYPSIAKHCNLWRNWGDIQDSWASLSSIIEWFAVNQDTFAHLAGPGKWNDPDMVIGGNFGLSYDQAKVQMAVWAIMASPLIMSNDLRRLAPEFKELLLNRRVIKINQDPMGIQGRRIKKQKKMGIFVRPVMPSFMGNVSAAVAIVNTNDGGSGDVITFSLSSIGLNHPTGYEVSEVFSGKMIGNALPANKIKLFVNPTGVQFLRFDLQPKHHRQEKEPRPNHDEAPAGIQVLEMGKSGRAEYEGTGGKPTSVPGSCN